MAPFNEHLKIRPSPRTDRENEDHLKQAALQESEERYRTLVETSPDAITLTDLEGKVILCNRQAARLHGFDHPKEMRLMVYEMRPLGLHQVGLLEALRQRLDAVEKRAGIQNRLEVEGEIKLPAPLEEELYSITQEALNNSLKHAASTLTVVRLHAGGENVMIEVSDNGKGFILEAEGNSGGMGLDSMQERARSIGANLTIVSGNGQGTMVRVAAKLSLQGAESQPEREVSYE